MGWCVSGCGEFGLLCCSWVFGLVGLVLVSCWFWFLMWFMVWWRSGLGFPGVLMRRGCALRLVCVVGICCSVVILCLLWRGFVLWCFTFSCAVVIVCVILVGFSCASGGWVLDC